MSTLKPVTALIAAAAAWRWRIVRPAWTGRLDLVAPHE